ncbi:MAG: FG-GAP-like repeat-containing protein, partial [bacterium]|nr:FG-GAP-like repeat-containing protein [bacterium]
YEHVLSAPDNYGGIWGFDADFALQYVIPGWDLVEESPVISTRDRLKITRILFEFITACVSHVGNVEHETVRHNHSTYAALGLLYAGTYFKKYYGLPEADEWLALSKKCFGPQTRAFKPSEDCGHYQWRTHVHTMRYTLSTGDMTFFNTGNAQKAGDYAILTSDNIGYGVPNGDTSSPFGTWSEIPYLRAMICITGDGRYQWLLDKKLALAPRHTAYEHNRRVEPVEPLNLDGTQVFPVDPLYHKSNNGDEHLPLSKTFDKVIFRDGFHSQNQYLFLDGLSNGGHKHYDGNSICRLTQNNRIWLADCDYIKSLPKFHNGVLIFKNGQSEEIPPFTELERAAAFKKTGFSETTLRSYSGVDWHRNILWNRGEFFLVIDKMEALEKADYSFRAVWQTLGDVQLKNGGITVEQNGEHFFIHGLDGPRLKLEDDPVTGKNWANYTHAEPVVRILQQMDNVHLKKRETYTFFNLLYCAPQTFRMTQLTNTTVRIDGENEVLFAGIGQPNKAQSLPGGPTVAAAQFQISPTGFALVGSTKLAWGKSTFESQSPIGIEYDLIAGEGTLIATKSTRLTLSVENDKKVELNGKLITSEFSKNTLTFTIPKGQHDFRLVPYVVHNLHQVAAKKTNPTFTSPKPIQHEQEKIPDLKTTWTYSAESAFLSLAATDLDGDGKDEVIAGGRTATICALKDGKAAWQYPTGGTIRSVCTADLENDGKPEVIAGSEDTHVYVLNAKGKQKWAYKIPFYFQDPIVRSVFTGDLNGDGKLEVVAAVESWRYYAFTHNGKELWHQMTVRPSSTGCAADLDGDGKDEVIAGTDYHSWHCIDGNGDIRWSYHPRTGPRTNSAAAGDVDGDGLKEAAFAGADTHIHLLKADGKLLWQFNTGDEVTQVAMADMDGDGIDEIVASSMSFNVYNLKGDGKTLLWRTDLGEVIRCIAVAGFNGDGKLEVAAGVHDGWVYLLANENGHPLARFQTGGSILDLTAADTDGDGISEIAAASEDGKVYILKA